MTETIEIGGTPVQPGQRISLRLPVARRLTAGQVDLPVAVVNGRESGPRLFLSAAVHGDEINGTEIIRRLLRMPVLKKLRGALIAVPIVNVYGFIAHSRYLPDRRDLNRSFPGSPKGSLAARLAHTFLGEIVDQSTHGIDLHTGALHRTNLPQIRATLSVKGVEALAMAFGAPVVIDAGLREGSLRAAASKRGIPILVYEAGEALRFDEVSIRAGIQGILAVMRRLEMLPPETKPRRSGEPVIARGSNWVRAPETGILSTRLKLGASVREGERLGAICDPLGEDTTAVLAPSAGVLIGRTNLPLVNEGDALFHVASFKRPDDVVEEVDAFRMELEDEPIPS